jgi:DNA-binding XRE family transcriptional regulator
LQVLKKTKKTTKQKSILARNIIQGRERLGMSAEEFAELAGIPYPTLRDIEADISGGRQSTKEKIAKALGVGVEDLYVSRENSTTLLQMEPGSGKTVTALSWGALKALREGAKEAVKEELAHALPKEANQDIERLTSEVRQLREELDLLKSLNAQIKKIGKDKAYEAKALEEELEKERAENRRLQSLMGSRGSALAKLIEEAKKLGDDNHESIRLAIGLLGTRGQWSPLDEVSESAVELIKRDSIERPSGSKNIKKRR